MDKRDNKKNIKRKIKSIRVAADKSIKTDVLGSYTGVPDELDERPVQDADDL